MEVNQFHAVSDMSTPSPSSCGELARYTARVYTKRPVFSGHFHYQWLPSAMVARLASIAQRYQKVAGSSPAVVILFAGFLFDLRARDDDSTTRTRRVRQL